MVQKTILICTPPQRYDILHYCVPTKYRFFKIIFYLTENQVDKKAIVGIIGHALDLERRAKPSRKKNALKKECISVVISAIDLHTPQAHAKPNIAHAGETTRKTYSCITNARRKTFNIDTDTNSAIETPKSASTILIVYTSECFPP